MSKYTFQLACVDEKYPDVCVPCDTDKWNRCVKLYNEHKSLPESDEAFEKRLDYTIECTSNCIDSGHIKYILNLFRQIDKNHPRYEQFKTKLNYLLMKYKSERAEKIIDDADFDTLIIYLDHLPKHPGYYDKVLVLIKNALSKINLRDKEAIKALTKLINKHGDDGIDREKSPYRDFLAAQENVYIEEPVEADIELEEAQLSIPKKTKSKKKKKKKSLTLDSTPSPVIFDENAMLEHQYYLKNIDIHVDRILEELRDDFNKVMDEHQYLDEFISVNMVDRRFAPLYKEKPAIITSESFRIFEKIHIKKEAVKKEYIGHLVDFLMDKVGVPIFILANQLEAILVKVHLIPHKSINELYTDHLQTAIIEYLNALQNYDYFLMSFIWYFHVRARFMHTDVSMRSLATIGKAVYEILPPIEKYMESEQMFRLFQTHVDKEGHIPFKNTALTTAIYTVLKIYKENYDIRRAQQVNKKNETDRII